MNPELLADRFELCRRDMQLSSRDLSTRARLGPSHYDSLIGRIRTAENPRPSAGTVEQIVGVFVEAGYGEDWLRTGRGVPKVVDGPTDLFDVYEAVEGEGGPVYLQPGVLTNLGPGAAVNLADPCRPRALAALAARVIGLLQEAIDLVYAEQARSPERAAQQWLRLFRDTDRRLRRAKKEGGDDAKAGTEKRGEQN